MKARKKPVEIDYLVWDGNSDSLQIWMNEFNESISDYFILRMDDEADDLKVKTLEGTSYEVPIGYVIIRGVEGEYYPCEPSIFNKTYEVIKPTLKHAKTLKDLGLTVKDFLNK